MITRSLGTWPQDVHYRFEERRKLLSNPGYAKKVAHRVQDLLAAGQTDALRALLTDYYPADIADVLTFLDDAQDRAVVALLDAQEAAEVLDEVDDCTREQVLQVMPPDRIAQIVQQLPADEGTDLAQALPPGAREAVLTRLEPVRAEQIRRLLAYSKESAGGLMSLGMVTVRENASMRDALQAYAAGEHAEPVPVIYVVDGSGALTGVLELREVIKADGASPVRDHMAPPSIWVHPDVDREKVARMFARYDLTVLPVVEPAPSNRLIGIITADDVIDVVEAEVTEDMMRMAGSDAEEMERRSPARTALLRLPWIMATMFIELGAGVVIHFYDATLARVLLLASFMPIISAISGNTGLQSATIVVRGLSTGQVHAADWQRALVRQLIMTVILGATTGLVLGTIGAIWYGKWVFGLVVFIGMFAAVNIAGVVGTVVPLISKQLGFDPAITSGPFETAFQDVVGISIFLTLATVMLRLLT